MSHAIFFNPPIESSFIGHQMAEVYRDRVYAPIVEGKKDLTIIDVGANIGITTYYFSRFAKHVYSLEPAVEHFETLTEMIKHNKLENVTPIKKALYIEEDEFTLHHNENKTMYSLHGAVAQNQRDNEKVSTITIEKLFDKYKIEHCDLFKLDVEGSEVEIISGPGFKKVAPKISTLLTEVHEWSGRHPNQITDALRMNGFNVQQVPSTANLLMATR